MAAFWSTYTNKVDKKGRVSIPAAFRTHLIGPSFQGVVVFPAFRSSALECRSYEQMDRMTDAIDALPEFSPERDALATALFGASVPLPFDTEGRIVLPKHLADHAGITDEAAFLGKGNSFQIWEPKALAKHMAEARDRVALQGLSLPALHKPTTPQNGGAS